MPFDPSKLDRARLSPRTATVEVPDLGPLYFADGEPAVWHVRGLNGPELFTAMEAGKRQAAASAAAKALEQFASVAVSVNAVRDVLGLGKEVPGEWATRLEMVVAGSIEPNKIDLAQAVKLGEAHPVEFMMIHKKIERLTGMGHALGEPKAASPVTQD